MMRIHVAVHRVWVLLLTLLLLAPGLASPPQTHAFALSVHKQILQDALQGKMSAQALGWVIGYYALVAGSGNLGSDVHLLTPTRHFANAPTRTLIGFDYYALPLAKAQLAQWRKRRAAPAPLPGRPAPRGPTEAEGWSTARTVLRPGRYAEPRTEFGGAGGAAG